MEYRIERASEKDGKEMLEIIEALPSKGVFELLYTRRPDAYSSYKKESEQVEIGVIRDNDGKIILQGACILHDYYLNGESCSIGYLGGIRKRPDFKGILNWMEMLTKVKQYVPCDMYYCSVLADNKLVMAYLTRKRKNIPQLEKICDYTTYVINPRAVARKKWNLPNCGLVFRRAEQSDLVEIQKFLNNEGQKHDFFPKINNLEQDFYNMRVEDCFLLERGHKIIAFTALWDQSSFRQYIVTKYNKPLNYMRKVDKLTQFLGYVPFPEENQALKFPHFAFFLVKDDDMDIYKYFLYKISTEIKSKTNMAVIGIPNESPTKREVYDKLRTLSFQSTLFFINFSRKKIRFDNKLFIECGLL